MLLYNITMSYDMTNMLQKSDIRYKIGFDPSLNLSPEYKAHFRSIVKEVLDDDNGWKKYGYHFTCLSTSKSDIIHPDFYMELAGPEKIKSTCNLIGLSCYHPTGTKFLFNQSHFYIPTIFIHIGNWNGGSKSKLPLDKYRYYAINHEVGHFLGLSHPPSDHRCGSNGVAYVMNQMSLGAQAIYPCLYENYLP
eukprot:Pompholyxophrys_sp_v1_NODE_3_length_18401_cov_4.332280.p8 type:complete len:192 gc:universal NODE_3_length_18401_cov_4.332280:6455-7030(+)